MSSITRVTIPLLAVLFVGSVALPSDAQTSPPEHALRESNSDAGSNIKRDLVWNKKIPLNRRYHELTPEEKAALNECYEKIEIGDEPPFPAEGLRPIVDALSKAQDKLRVTGELRLLVDVDANGDATSIAAYGSPSPEMTKFSASILMLTKFKPAVCRGQPCKMQYPFYWAFRVR